ncbi:MAG TPA: ATP-dependent helicase [Nitrospira sp.]|nr:ATP-dependent helicase [Nitrospira sp.]
MSPDQILVLSFSKSAVEELKSRLRPLLNLTKAGVMDDAEFKEETRMIRTLHSLAYESMKEMGAKLLSTDKFQKFCDEKGWDISPSMGGLFEMRDGGTHDRVWNVLERSRLSGRPIEELTPYAGEVALARRLKDEYDEFKENENVCDYTEMIEFAITNRAVPAGIRAILVDEAQDMCDLMYRYHQVLLQELQEGGFSAWYGDEDQCLYTFMEAEPRFFVEMPAEHTVLGEQSYRVPTRIAALAQSIIEKNRDRLPKIIQGVRGGGEIIDCDSVSSAADEAMKRDGEVLWLAPTNHQVDMIKAQLLAAGYPVKLSRDLEDAKRAMRLIQDKPKTLTQEELGLLLTAKVGKKLIPLRKDWFVSPRDFNKWYQGTLNGSRIYPPEGLEIATDDRLTDKFKALFNVGAIEGLGLDDRQLKVLASLGESRETGRIQLMTIHAAKGLEAPTVVLCSEARGKMYEGFIDQPDTLRRLLFVGVTRAKETLIFHRRANTTTRELRKLVGA